MPLLKSRVPNRCGSVVDLAFHPSTVDEMNAGATCGLKIKVTSVHVVALRLI